MSLENDQLMNVKNQYNENGKEFQSVLREVIEQLFDSYITNSEKQKTVSYQLER